MNTKTFHIRGCASRDKVDIKAMPSFSLLMGNRRPYNRLQDVERRLAGSHEGTGKDCGHLSSIKTEFCIKKKSSFLFAARCALFGDLVGILQLVISIQNKHRALTDLCQTSSFLSCTAAHTCGSRWGNQLMYTTKTQHPTEPGGRARELLNPGLKASWCDNTRT